MNEHPSSLASDAELPAACRNCQGPRGPRGCPGPMGPAGPQPELSNAVDSEARDVAASSLAVKTSYDKALKALRAASAAKNSARRRVEKHNSDPDAHQGLLGMRFSGFSINRQGDLIQTCFEDGDNARAGDYQSIAMLPARAALSVQGPDLILSV